MGLRFRTNQQIVLKLLYHTKYDIIYNRENMNLSLSVLVEVCSMLSDVIYGKR